MKAEDEKAICREIVSVARDLVAVDYVLVTGNTYPYREDLKAMGGRWDATNKGWRIPKNRVDEANRLIGNKSYSQPSSRPSQHSVPSRSSGKSIPNLRSGEQLVTRPSKGKSDQPKDKGEVAYFPKVRAGGGPDGHYFYVADSGKSLGMDFDDDPEWQCWMVVRAATDKEAEPLVLQNTKKVSKQQLDSKLSQLCRSGVREAGQMPVGAVQLEPKNHTSLVATGTRVAVVDDVIWYERAGDPDMSDSWYHYITKLPHAPPELVAEVKKFISG